eukprot:15474782-Alexandrium_andersonii.AAC.1
MFQRRPGHAWLALTNAIAPNAQLDIRVTGLPCAGMHQLAKVHMRQLQTEATERLRRLVPTLSIRKASPSMVAGLTLALTRGLEQVFLWKSSNELDNGTEAC